MTSFFDHSVINSKCDLDKSYAFVNSFGVCSLKAKPKAGLIRWQNGDLYHAYDKLAKLKFSELESDLKGLNVPQLKNISHYINSIYLKIDKSRKPSALAQLAIKAYNLFAGRFRLNKIGVYEYDRKNKLLEINNRIDVLIKVKLAPPPPSPIPAPPKTIDIPAPAPAPAPAPSPDAPKNHQSKKDNWDKLGSKPVVVPKQKKPASQSGAVASSSHDLPPPVVSPGALQEFAEHGEYAALLDGIKKNYLPDIQAELQRLRESDVYTKEHEKILNKHLNVVEKQKGYYSSSAEATKNNRETIKVAVGRALEIKKYFKDKYYVLTHSQDTRWVVITYLIKELVRESYTKQQIHHFKFLRLPKDKPIRTTNFTGSSRVHDHDTSTRRALISSDAYLFNNCTAESTLYFLSHNASVASYDGVSKITNTASDMIKEMYPYNTTLANKLNEVVSKYVAEIGKNMPTGTLHVFCIPKDKAIKGEYASVYRSHPYGVVCDCSHLKKMGDYSTGHEKAVIDRLQNDEELRCSNSYFPQYRIIAPNLKPEEVMIKSFTPLDKAMRHEIKQAIRDTIKKYK